MDDLLTLQQRVRDKRTQHNAATEAFYQSFQRWVLLEGELRQRQSVEGRALPDTDKLVVQQKADRAQLDLLFQQRRDAQIALDAARALVAQAGTPQQLMEQLPADTPFLLMPLRVEARYLTFRHVVRNLPFEDIVDVSKHSAAAAFVNTGFSTNEDGVLTWSVPALHLVRSSQTLKLALQNGTLKPASTKLIKQKADREELWIRIYPDEIFKEGLEKNLLKSELEIGKAYWQKIWSGTDPETAWIKQFGSMSAPRAAWIVRSTQPLNYKPGTKLPPTPTFPSVALKNSPYTQAPVARVLPDRFVVRLEKKDKPAKEFIGKLIPEPLALGLDPMFDPFNKTASNEFSPAGTVLKSPEQLRWMHDLKAAEELGLAICIDLKQHPEFNDGVDKIFVLGTKTSSDATEAGRLLNGHFENCLYKENGLSILPQGMPTNNYIGQKSGFNQREEEAKSYFRSEWGIPANGDTDQLRLRQALGLRESFRLPGGDTTDLREAMLMNTLLYPATWGYYLLQFFTPAISDDARERVRHFFTNRVSGRGHLPILRINSQPYGIIPTTSLEHWQYTAPNAEEQFLAKLWTQFLAKLNTEWAEMAAAIIASSTIANSGKLNDQFLKMLGLSASAVQFQRQMMLGTGFQSALLNSTVPGVVKPLAQLQKDSGFKPHIRTQELFNVGLDASLFEALTGSYLPEAQKGKVRFNVIDGLPLLEDRSLELLPGRAWNYLEWLAKSPLETIWNSDNLNFSNAPSGEGATDRNGAAFSILAILAKQAVLREMLETGLRIAEPNPGLWLLKAKNFELEHLQSSAINVNPLFRSTENLLLQQYKPIIDKYKIQTSFVLEPDRWVYFTKKYPKTGNLVLAKWLDDALANKTAVDDPALKNLRTQKAALEVLAKLPTARLERLFAEHSDLCSHRLDAWIHGLLQQRIEKQRKAKPEGIFLGAFGYLLGLKPNPQRAVVLVAEKPEYLPLTAANVDAAAIPIAYLSHAAEKGFDPKKHWSNTFFYIGQTSDTELQLNTHTSQVEPAPNKNNIQSEGFIHAPSLAHATAAAILRAGYQHHKTDTNAESLSINLNAPRVRQASLLLEGMQQGSTLAELLGYHLERLLHEYGLDKLLYDLRRDYPLQRSGDSAAPSLANKFTTTDGLKVIAAAKKKPFASPLQDVVNRITDMLDAVGDLLLTESVYQTTKGNTDRAAAALRTLNSGGQIVQPEWTRIPRRELPLNHRVGIVFDQGATDPSGKVWSSTGSPRAALSPALNRWLAQQLPKPETIIAVLTTSEGKVEKVSLAETGIEPIDLLYACPTTFTEAGQSPLAMLLQLTVRKRPAIATLETEMARNGKELIFRIDFRSRVQLLPAELSVFEISALITNLHKIVQNVRPLTPDDFRLPDLPGAPGKLIDSAKLKAALTVLLPQRWPCESIVKTLRENSTSLNVLIGTEKPLTELRKAAGSIFSALQQAWLYGVQEALSGVSSLQITPENAFLLYEKAQKIASELETRNTQKKTLIGSLPANMASTQLLKQLEEVAKVMFGSDIRLFPDITLDNVAEIQGCYNERSLLEKADPDAIDDWLREAALVRPALKTYRRAALLRELVLSANAGKLPEVLQLPFQPGKRRAWIGGPFDTKALPEERSVLSLVFEFPTAFNTNSVMSGFIIDAWPEFVPIPETDTGLSFQYNQPDTEPAQAMLLAVCPVEGGNWQWDFLMSAVKDALDMSKKRLVAPDNIRASNQGLGQVLPAMTLPFMHENNQVPTTEIN